MSIYYRMGIRPESLKSTRPYLLTRQKLGADRRPVLKAAFNVAHGEYREDKFGSREPIMHHLYETADILWSWGSSDDVIAAGICHRFSAEGLKASASQHEAENLSRVLPVIDAYRHIRDFQPLEVQNRLSDPDLIRNNYWKMLLRSAADQGGFSDDQLFNALIVMAADQLSTLRSAGIGYWNLELDRQVYSNIALSTADMLRELTMENEAGEIFDACLETLEPAKYKDLFAGFYGDTNCDLAIMKGHTHRLIENYLKAGLRTGRPESISDVDMQFSVHSRMKTLSSAAKKVQDKGAGSVSDLIGYKIILNLGDICDSIDKLKQCEKQRRDGQLTENELREKRAQYFGAKDAVYHCNAVLSALAAEKGWAEIDQRYDNYLEGPKPNGYQSIQRNFICRTGSKTCTMEVQLQTTGMHEWASWGGASHSRYKSGRRQTTEIPSKSTVIERFAELRSAVTEFGYGFKAGERIRGPLQIACMDGREAVVMDLAFAIDPSWALKGAQFWRTAARGGDEEECTAGTLLRNGDILRVVTSHKVRVSPQRVRLAGTGEARKALYNSYLDQNYHDPEAIKRRGEQQLIQLIRDEGSGLLEKIMEANGTSSRQMLHPLLTQIPVPHILYRSGLVFCEEMEAEIGIGNTRLLDEVRRNVMALACDPKKREIWTAIRNRAAERPVIDAFLNSGIGLRSFSFSRAGDMVLVSFGLDEFVIGGFERLAANIFDSRFEENESDPLDRKQLSLKARSNFWDDKTVRSVLELFKASGVFMINCGIGMPRGPQAGQMMAIETVFAFHGNPTCQKIQRLKTGIDKILRAETCSIE